MGSQVGHVEVRDLPRQRIVAALSYLEELGDLVVQVSGVRQGYRTLEPPGNLQSLCANLSERFLKREENDIARVGRMLELTQHDGCLTKHLLAYFGEARGDCGHCDRCDGVRGRPLPPARYTLPGESDVQRLRQLQAEGHEALAAPRQLARFLCGIASPATTRARLSKHDMFGAFASAPFHRILTFVKEL